MRGTSMPDVGDFNEKLALQAVRRAEDGLSQAQIGRSTGLSRQAVSLIVRRLTEQGLLRSAGLRNGGRGKPHTVLEVVATSRFAAGVHLDPAHITVVIIDLLAQPVLTRTLQPPTDDPDADLDRIVGAIQSMRVEAAELLADQEHPVPVHDGMVDLLGIGVTAPGGVDPDRGVIIDPPWLRGWQGFEIAARIRERTSLPATLTKDTHAALTAEIWAGRLADAGTVLYLYVGDGVGSAVADDGQVRRGGGGHAGEIGHLPTGLQTRRCSCGRMGCQSLLTDVRAILADARARGVLDVIDTPADVPALVRRIVERADTGDEEAQAVLREPGLALAWTMRTLCGIHDPDRVIVGGPYWDVVGRRALPVLQAAAAEFSTPGHVPVEVNASTLGASVGAIGAATLLLERELSPHGLGV